MNICKYTISLFCLFFSLGANANCHESYPDNTWYVKGGLGLNTVSPIKIRDDEYKGKIKVVNYFPLIEAGVGYCFSDGVRLEAGVDYYFTFRSKERSFNNEGNQYAINTNTKGHALFINAYKDITTFKGFTPFVGGGVGLSYLHEKAKGFVVSPQQHLHFNLDS